MRQRSLLVFSLLAVAAVIVLPRLRPAEPQPALLSDCDLNSGPCLVRLDASRAVEVAITPRPLPVMQPLALDVRTVGFAAPATAYVDFSGIGMNMGPNRAELKRQDVDRLSGPGSLPICVTGAMDWQAELILGSDEAATRVALRFRAPLAARP